MNTVMLIYFAVLLLAVAVYYVVPKRGRWIVLLTFSLLFYLLISTYLIVFLLATALSVYFAARYVLRPEQEDPEKKADESADPTAEKTAAEKRARRNKSIIVLTILFNLALIGVLKYYNFFGQTFSSLLSLAGLKVEFPVLRLALPLGISFYTLSAIGYMVDIHRGKYAAERNFGKFCLFLCFFPQILEGPICRYDQTAGALQESHSADAKGMLFGVQRIVWGLFKKMVVADRLYLLVKTIGDTPAEYSGIASILFMVCYTIQLYADFSGFIDIALGSGESAVFCKECAGVLAALAYNAGGVAEGVCILFGSAFAAGDGAGGKAEKESKEPFYEDAADDRGVVCGMVVQRIMARAGMEIYCIRNVLFCDHCGRNACGTVV